MPRFLRAILGACVIAVVLPAAAAAKVSTTGVPTISGTDTVGQTLTCTGPTWTSNDGGTPTPVDYTWYHSDDHNSPISESFSTTRTYKLVGSDAGHQIQCTQTEEDEGDFNEATSGFSNPTPAVAGGAPPTTTGQTTISGTGQAGNFLFCQGPTWKAAGGSSDFVDTTFNWYYSTNTTTPLSGGSNTSDYTVKQADVGKNIVCIETATDEQTGGKATSQSAALTIRPTAGIVFTQYNPKITGTIGESVTGVTVKLTLDRFVGGTSAPRAVATGSTTTNASGQWAITLTPSVAGANDAFAVEGDQLVVTYSGGAAGTVLPVNTTYDESGVDFAGQSTTISSDGKTVAASVGPCSNVTIQVDGTTNATASASGLCQFKPSTALTDNNHVQTHFAEKVLDETSNMNSNVTTLSDVGLLGEGFAAGEGQGAPTCSADLVSGQVICQGLNGKTFTVTGGTSAPVTLTNVQESSHGNFVEDQGSGFLTGLTAGKTVVLKESGLARAISTLNLVTLRVDYGVGGTASGSCQPNKMFGGGDEEGLCPTSGTFTSGQGALFDDLSGGQTLVNVPTVENRIPSDLDSISSSAFTAYGDLFNVGTTAQVLAQTKSISLSIVPHAGGAAAFTGTPTTTSDAVGPFAFDNVSGLKQGRFFANWTLTDSHSDTRRYSDEFAVQPANPAAAAVPATVVAVPGPQGPAGQNGTSSKVVCTTTKYGTAKHRKSQTTCKVSVVAPGSRTVTVAVTRGKRTIASASARARAGRARVTLRHAGRLRHGRYLVTVLSITGSKTTVTRRFVRL